MSDGKISCAICNAQTHFIRRHLKEAHPEMTIEAYETAYPGAPLMSVAGRQALEKKAAETAAAAAAQAEPVAMAGTAAAVAEKPQQSAVVKPFVPKGGIVKKHLHEVFELGAVKAAMSQKGDPIPISVVTEHDQQDYVPAVHKNYVYDIDELKNVIIAMEIGMPAYIFGHKGSGKTELVEQVCARTNRPLIRVQHTVNTEEAHIVGQWTVKGGSTVFSLGPLALAMLNGWVYLADEYDFGLPSVLAVYQPVLEGKSLVIKEAEGENRIIKPHPLFRFVATGNTNGAGDETGLYAGTVIQNSANYDRFTMCIHKKYMDAVAEQAILKNHCKLVDADAKKMVDFAKSVRDAHDSGKLSDTISPRALIAASRIGVLRGSFRQGLNLAFINKLPKVDREVADGLAQRVFG